MPSSDTLISWAKSVYDRYADVLSRMLGLPAPYVTWRVGDTGDGAASTVGTTITLSKSWFTNHPGDAGGIVHELVHAYQQIPDGESQQMSRFTEGIADAIRYKLGLVYEGWTPSKIALRFADLPPADLASVSRSMSAGTFLETRFHTDATQPSPAPTPAGGTDTATKTQTAVDNVESLTKYFRQYVAGKAGWDATNGQQIMDFLYRATGIGWAKARDQAEQEIKSANYGKYSNSPIPFSMIAAQVHFDLIREFMYQRGLGDVFQQALRARAQTGLSMWQEKSSETTTTTPDSQEAGAGDQGTGTTLDDLLKLFGQGGAASHQQQQNAAAAFEYTLSSYGIAMTPALQRLVDEASKGGWNQPRFLQELMTRPEFQQAFPGIFNTDGTLKMSPAQYLSAVRSYEAIASQYGINYTPKLQAELFLGDTSPIEFSQRAQADAQIRRNPELYRQFSIEAKRAGLADNVTKGHLIDFLLGIADKKWYDLWNNAESAYAATQAGISLKPGSPDYASLNRKTIERIGGKGLTPEQLASGYQQLAQQLLTTLPLSKIQGYGLSKRDLVQASFGGKKQAEVTQLIRRIMAQDQAFYQDRAAPSLDIGQKSQARGGTAE